MAGAIKPTVGSTVAPRDAPLPQPAQPPEKQAESKDAFVDDDRACDFVGITMMYGPKHRTFSVSLNESEKNLVRKAERWRAVIRKYVSAPKETRDSDDADTALRALGMIGAVWGEKMVPELIAWVDDPSLCQGASAGLAKMGANAWSALPALEHTITSAQEYRCRSFADQAVSKIREGIKNPLPGQVGYQGKCKQDP